MSYDYIAEVLGIPSGTVKSRINRAFFFSSSSMRTFNFSIKSTGTFMSGRDLAVEIIERIDEEEKKKARITRRVMRNVRRNWKQYTAAAACFALVAVVTANRICSSIR